MTHQQSREELTISGIDGGTPLGFLAGLGLLQLASEHDADSRLSWKQLDAWRPVIHRAPTASELVDLVVADAAQWADSPLLAFRYLKSEKQGPKTVGGLKAPLAVVRAWLTTQRDLGNDGETHYAAALFCDAVVEEAKKWASAEDHQRCGIKYDPDIPLDQVVERTFFDFTSRNAQFLEQVEAVRAYLTPEVVRTALERGTPDYNAPRTLDWDPTADTPGAIFTGYRRGLLPVHEWLAFRALRLFPMAAAGPFVRLTACSNRRLDGSFSWPLWLQPASLEAIRSLVGYPELEALSAEARRALGLSAIFKANLTKKADGYTGTFSPASPV